MFQGGVFTSGGTAKKCAIDGGYQALGALLEEYENDFETLKSEPGKTVNNTWRKKLEDFGSVGNKQDGEVKST